MEECGSPTMSDGDDRVLGVLENALERAFGGGLHGGVDLLDGDAFRAEAHREVDHGARRAWERGWRSRRACP